MDGLIRGKNTQLSFLVVVEAAVDLMRLVGLNPFGVLCELTNQDGTMARLPEIVAFTEQHNIKQDTH